MVEERERVPMLEDAGPFVRDARGRDDVRPAWLPPRFPNVLGGRRPRRSHALPRPPLRQHPVERRGGTEGPARGPRAPRRPRARARGGWTRLHQPPVDVDVVPHHARRVEAGVECPPARAAVERRDSRDGPGRLLDAFDDEARHAVLEDLRNRAVPPRDDGRSTGERLDHHQPERLGPVDREEQRGGVPEELLLVASADLADVLHEGPRLPEQGLDLRPEVAQLLWIDLRGDLELHPGALRDRDRTVEPLLRRDPAEEGEVVPGALDERIHLARQPVRNRRLPVRVRNRPPLSVGDRDGRTPPRLLPDGPEVRGVQRAVNSGDVRAGVPPEEREVQIVAVKMDRSEEHTSELQSPM